MSLSVIACSFVFLLSLKHSAGSSEISEEGSWELSESWETLFNSLEASCNSYYEDISREYKEIDQRNETPLCYIEVKKKLKAKEGDDVYKVEEIFYEMYESLSHKDQAYIYNCFEEYNDKVLDNVHQSEDCKNAIEELVDKLLRMADDDSSETSEEDSGELSESWELLFRSMNVSCKSYYDDISKEYIEMDVRREMPHCYTKVKTIVEAMEGDDTNRVQEMFYEKYDSLSDEDQEFSYNCLDECYKKAVKNVQRSPECHEAHEEYERKLKEMYEEVNSSEEE